MEPINCNIRRDKRETEELLEEQVKLKALWLPSDSVREQRVELEETRFQIEELHEELVTFKASWLATEELLEEQVKLIASWLAREELLEEQVKLEAPWLAMGTVSISCMPRFHVGVVDEQQVKLEKYGQLKLEKYEQQLLKLEASPFRQPRLISGRYSVQNINGKVRLQMEHCAFNGRRNQWNLEVKFRMQDKKFTGTNERWVNINELYPDAKVEMKHNFVYVTIDSPDENHEFAVFGTPEVNDKKRMQLALFGEKPVKGKDWKIWAILFDDTMMAFEHVCEMEEGRGRQLLSTLGGLLVTNCSQDIKINLTDMELGWQIKGSKVKTIKSNDAWNSPENSTDFPRCYFEVSHVDKTKQSFFCEVTASHKENTTDTDAMAFYEEAEKDEYAVQEESMACPDLNFGRLLADMIKQLVGSITKLISNWKLLPKILEVDAEAITGLEKYTDISPTVLLFEYLKITRPFIQELEKVLCEIGGSRWIKEVLVFFQMLVIVVVYVIGSAFS